MRRKIKGFLCSLLTGVLLLSGIVVYKHCICTEEESREEKAAV